MRSSRRFAFLLCSLLALSAPEPRRLLAAGFAPPKWDVAALRKPPAAIPAGEAREAGLESLYLEGLPYRGRPTRFYAYLGFPSGLAGKVPAVVLVHGGGGTATAPWAKYWTGKGYAALSLDTEGHVPVQERPRKPGDPGWKTIDSLGQPWAGQPQRPRGFADPTLPPEEQWLFHAVADALLSVSHLASLPAVDPDRIGIVGISMGSVVCSLAGGIDDRLAFVVPQYIGGNNQLGNVWYAIIKEHPEVLQWDPANFYRHANTRAHWLWIDGDNDKYGVPPMLTRSWRETGPDSWLALLPTQGHGGVFGETGPNALREIYAFADAVTRGAAPLPKILSTRWEPGKVTLAWQARVPVARAQLIHAGGPLPRTVISGDSRIDWEHVSYQAADLALPEVTTLADGSKQAGFPLPAGMTAGYVNLIDERGLAASCDFLQPGPEQPSRRP